jgi:hypothetical protein
VSLILLTTILLSNLWFYNWLEATPLNWRQLPKWVPLLGFVKSVRKSFTSLVLFFAPFFSTSPLLVFILTDFNVGCPSPSAQDGCFGVRLMDNVPLLIKILRAMKAAVESLLSPLSLFESFLFSVSRQSSVSVFLQHSNHGKMPARY